MDQNTSLARRDLLRVGATALGSAALGILPALTPAAQTTGRASVGGATAIDRLPVTPTVAIGYWNGTRFVAADSLSNGDATLDRARLTLTSVGTPGIDSLEGYAPVPDFAKVPFLLWVARPSGVERGVGTVVADPEGGVSLAAVVGKTRRELRLVTGRSTGAKLRAGTYILALGPVDWSGFWKNDQGQIVSRAKGVSGYVLVTVDPA